MLRLLNKFFDHDTRSISEIHGSWQPPKQESGLKTVLSLVCCAYLAAHFSLMLGFNLGNYLYQASSPKRAWWWTTGTPGGGGVAFSASLVQQQINKTATTASSAVTVTSTTAGNTIIACSIVQYSGTGIATLAHLDPVTENGPIETFTHALPAQINNSQNSNGTILGSDCYYIENTAGGATTITFPWNLTGLGTSSVKATSIVQEWHPNQTAKYDTANAKLDTGAGCTACIGPSGLQSGSADFLAQTFIDVFGGATPNSANSPYNTNFITDNASNSIWAAFSGAANQGTWAVPTWNIALSNSNPRFYSGVAFTAAATNVAITAQGYVDFANCTTNGVAPTTTCVGNSTYTGLGVKQGGLSSTDPGQIIAANTLVGPSHDIVVNGVVHHTSDTNHEWRCTNDTTGTNCGYYDMALGAPNSDMMVGQLTVAFSMKIDNCPGNDSTINTDCGASGIRVANDAVAGFYCVPHPAPLGNNKWSLECSNGSGQGDTGFAWSSGTEQRINMLVEGVTGRVNKMKLCSASGTFLASATANSGTNVPSSADISAFHIGWVGEEPTTVTPSPRTLHINFFAWGFVWSGDSTNCV